jgi:uncharacterized lipoprotein
MKKITVASLLAITLVSACSSPPEAPKAVSAPPKATTPPAPSQAAPSQAAAPSVGKIYGDTLKGGIDKAKEIQEAEKDRIQKMDEAAGQNQATPGE